MQSLLCSLAYWKATSVLDQHITLIKKLTSKDLAEASMDYLLVLDTTIT